MKRPSGGGGGREGGVVVVCVRRCVLWVWCARNTVSCVFCGSGVQGIQYHVCSVWVWCARNTVSCVLCVGVVCKEYSTMLTNIFEVLGIHSFSSCKARESHSRRGDTALQ